MIGTSSYAPPSKYTQQERSEQALSVLIKQGGELTLAQWSRLLIDPDASGTHAREQRLAMSDLIWKTRQVAFDPEGNLCIALT